MIFTMFQIMVAQMNRIIIVVSLIILTIDAHSQSSYYWSGGEKIQLSIDSSRLLILPQDINSINDKLKTIESIKKHERLRSNYVLVELKEGNALSFAEITSKISSKNLNYSFKTMDGVKIIPTGEILLSPKKGVSIETIIARSNASLSIQGKNKYGEYKLRLEGNFNILAVSNRIYESGLVQFAHPNFRAEITRFQNDPIYPEQYYLNNTGQFGGSVGIDINGPQALALSNGLNNVRVAVIDDGVENHEDINGRVLAGFTPTNPNGFGAPAAGGNHGQQCAGIIAATTNNALGITGIAQCSQIIPINIFNGGEDIPELVEAIDFAWDEGQADVLNNSWGFINQGAQFDAIIQAITRARTQGRGGLGSVVVFASGNQNQQFSGVTFPANVNGVVTVGAINKNGGIWNYSSRGAQMDLVAPSGNVNNTGDIRTTDRMGNNGLVAGNYVTTFGGTSAACPQVSGVAALMLSVNQSLTEAQIVNILRNTATDMGGAGFDNTFGFGRLNAQAAIQQALPTINGNALLCSTNSNYTLSFIPLNTTVSWSVAPTNLFATTTGASTSGIGGSASIRAINNTASGMGTITFNIQGNCRMTTITQTVWVGLPANVESIGLGFDTNQPFYVCPNTTYQFNAFDFINITGTTYNWYTYNYHTIQGGQGTISTNIRTGNYVDGTYISVRAQNSCGMSYWTDALLYESFSCGGGWEFFSVYPNPSDKYLDVEISEGEHKSSEFTSYEIMLLDNNGTEKFRTSTDDKSKRIDISSLKSGQYFLNVLYKGEVLQRQIVINR